MRERAFIILISVWAILSIPIQGYSQESNYDSLEAAYLKSDSITLNELEALLFSDTLSILDLIDSLLTMDIRFSQLSAYLSYTSAITNAGRDFGFAQYGLGGGLSYYHKTGLYADVSGYWNSDIEPHYNPTVGSIGYGNNLSSALSYNLSYDHYFYNKTNLETDSSYYPLTNSVNASLYLDIGKFTLNSDYSFLFGKEYAHRLRGNLMFTVSKYKLGFIDKISLIPNLSILLGDENIYYLDVYYPQSGSGIFRIVYDLMVEEYGSNTVFFLWRHNRTTFNELFYQTYEENKDDIITYETSSENVFGIMNYSLSIPLYFYIKNFTFSLTYHLNIPVALPGEELELETNSYFGASLIYSIPFRKKAKSKR